MADNTPVTAAPSCNIVRTAKATVRVYKNSWTQTDGIWVRQSAELVSSTADINVVTGNGNGCIFPTAIRLDSILLNGQQQTINVNAHILAPDNTGNKTFLASYYLSGNGGRYSNALAWTPDLTLKNIGLNIANERAADAATAHEETLNITVWFDDSAQ